MKRSWKSLKSLIQKFVPNVCAICFLASCQTFDWKPDVYVGDHYRKQLVRHNGETVPVGSSDFSKFVCFPPENISQLRTAIDKVNNRKTKSATSNIFGNLSARIIKARLK